MSESELRNKLRARNAITVSIGVLLVPTALFLWWLSWHVAYVLIAAPLELIELGDKALYWWGAWIFVGLLAFEGFFVKRQVFSLTEYAGSGFKTDAYRGSTHWWNANMHNGNPLAIAWFVVQIMFCAPHATLEAIRRLKAFMHVDDDTIRQATTLLRRLRNDRKWLAYEACGASIQAVALLRRLDLIWTDRELGKLRLRYPAGVE